MKILVTGGAGFIGSHLCDRLLVSGHDVTAFDSLEGQVHPSGKKPAYLSRQVKFVKGDVRSPKKLGKALNGADAIFHLAARVGIGQSNYEVRDFVDANATGTATLCQAIIAMKKRPSKIIVAASNTQYGEGPGQCRSCGVVKPGLRTSGDIKAYGWEPACPNCHGPLKSVPVTENAGLSNNSVYSQTKQFQESLLHHFGRTYGIPVTSFRFFNVYGPRQSLSNPYTGVTAIFTSRAKAGNQPVIFEDGNQTRDFVSVHDVVGALMLGISNPKSDSGIFNVGSGTPTRIKDVAGLILGKLGSGLEPKITGEYRNGDIRHCTADCSKLVGLGWTPSVSFSQGLGELIEWGKKEESVDLFGKAHAEWGKKLGKI